MKAFLRKFASPSKHRNTSESSVQKTGWLGVRAEARLFAVITLAGAFYFIACNSGSGWLYLLAASLATVALAGSAAPMFFCSKVSVKQQAPLRCVAGQILTVAIRVSSKLPGQLPLYWLRICYEFGKVRSQPYAVKSAKSDELVLITMPAIQRGVHRLGNIRLSTCFPLGMLWAQRTHYPPQGQTITAYPRTVAVDGFFLYKLPPSASGTGGLARGARSARQSTSTRGVREYVRGDSPRIVHWASTARTGRLLVREFEAEGLPRFDVLLDLCANWESQHQFELAVTTAASLLSLGYRLGTAPQLMIYPQQTVEAMKLPPCAPGIELNMEILARVQPLKLNGQSVQTADSAQAASAAPARLSAERSLVAILPQADSRLDDCYRIEIASATQPAPAATGSSAFGRPLIKSEEDITKL